MEHNKCLFVCFFQKMKFLSSEAYGSPFICVLTFFGSLVWNAASTLVDLCLCYWWFQRFIFFTIWYLNAQDISILYICLRMLYFSLNLLQGGGWKVVASFEGNFPNRIKQLPLDKHFDIKNVKRVLINGFFVTQF